MKRKFIVRMTRIIAEMIALLWTSLFHINYTARATEGGGWSIVFAEPVLIAHVVLAFVLLFEVYHIGKIIVDKGAKLLLVIGGIGALASVVAFVAGVVYTSNLGGKSTMAVGWFVALVTAIIVGVVGMKYFSDKGSAGAK